MHTRVRNSAPLAALLAIVLIALSTPAAARSIAPAQQAVAPISNGRIIVQLRSGELARQAAVRPDAVASGLAALAGDDLAYVRAGGVPGMHIVALPADTPAAEVEAAAQRITASPQVLYAEPDSILTIARTPTDPRFAGDMWHLKAVVASGSAGGNNNFGANLPAAWDVTTGSESIVAAVIDTGGLLTHEDLAGRAPAGNPGYDTIADAAIANDGGGRDSDPSDPGDWVEAADLANPTFNGCGVSDSSWHGSHVAGTIAASANNGKGITGINWVSKVLHMRALGKCGGFNSDIADAIRWAAGLPVSGLPANPNPARVINMSLGGPLACGTTLQTAITAATNAGAVVVAAAGNETVSLDTTPQQPATCAGVITVAATNQDGNRADYSNYGSTVEIAAPGGDLGVDPRVISSINTGTTSPVADTYTTYEGTSMATPHVAGVVSLMLSVNPALTNAQVLEILQATVTPFPAYSDCTTSICGAGILNAGKAVEEAARRVRTLSWQTAAQSVSEGAGSVTIPVTLSVPSSAVVSVPYTVGGSAGAADRTLAAGTISFPVGVASANLSFNLADDAIFEGNETVVVTLGTPGGSPPAATIAGSTAHTVTIVDNEGQPTTPTLSVDGAAATESAGVVSLTFTVRRDGPLAAASASYTVRAEGPGSTMRQVATGTAGVAAGAFSSEVTISIPRSQLGLATALEVTLSAPSAGAILGTNVSQRVELGAAERIYMPLLTK